MVRNRTIEVIVGLFMVLAFLALIFLAFEVSGINFSSHKTYYLTADFDDIGSLKVRAPVQVSGVTVGRVSDINLDPKTFRARVTLEISAQYNDLPIDTSASIFTQGILGSNYIALSPGYEAENLKSGGHIDTTHSALILENLIGQLLFSLKSDKSKQPEGQSSSASDSSK
ncbi:MAG: outer membrane lipid asymmetry maintenance protein MlaD [Proteobacteria bacterium]|nr:outer membrane lipid asymmetry maintenance protein MlaD [Pseudomonadota bacterium]